MSTGCGDVVCIHWYDCRERSLMWMLYRVLDLASSGLVAQSIYYYLVRCFLPYSRCVLIRNFPATEFWFTAAFGKCNAVRPNLAPKAFYRSRPLIKLHRRCTVSCRPNAFCRRSSRLCESFILSKWCFVLTSQQLADVLRTSALCW